MTLFGLDLPDEVVFSLLVGITIPLAMKIVEHYTPWLVIDGAGSHIKRADQTEP